MHISIKGEKECGVCEMLAEGVFCMRNVEFDLKIKPHLEYFRRQQDSVRRMESK